MSKDDKGRPASNSAATNSAASKPGLDKELLDIVRCPLSLRPLVLKGDKLYCYESRKAYRIEDGIPVLLIDEAEEIPESEVPEEFRGKPVITSPDG